jgi:hypothetical protein
MALCFNNHDLSRIHSGSYRPNKLFERPKDIDFSDVTPLARQKDE